MRCSKSDVDDYFSLVTKTLDAVDRKSMVDFITKIMRAYESDHTLFVFGNGGSGANAAHFYGDFFKGLSYGRKKRFKVVCLNDNIPAMLAIANDIDYSEVFVEQLRNFLKKDDIVIGISGSGNSPNIVKALEYANEVGATSVAMCGYDGGTIKKIADIAVHAEIDDMEVSEDIHLVMIHCIKRTIMNYLNKSK